MVENGIEVREYEIVDSDASLLASGQLIYSFARNEAHDKVQKAKENSRIWIDPLSCCLALYAKLASDRVLMQQSPLALAKAIKVCWQASLFVHDSHFPTHAIRTACLNMC